VLASVCLACLHASRACQLACHLHLPRTVSNKPSARVPPPRALAGCEREEMRDDVWLRSEKRAGHHDTTIACFVVLRFGRRSLFTHSHRRAATGHQTNQTQATKQRNKATTSYFAQPVLSRQTTQTSTQPDSPRPTLQTAPTSTVTVPSLLAGCMYVP
jgi:hypothetical protein